MAVFRHSLAPGAPAPQGAIDPARALGATNPARGAAMDPAMRLDPAGRTALAAENSGIGVAMLIHHAMGMAIEGSALRTIADQVAGGSADPTDSKTLLDHANRSMMEGQKLLGQAAADGRGLAAVPPVRRFHSAANLYISNLMALEKVGPTEKARVALINHAVKETLDANIILRMGPAGAGNGPMEQLLRHANAMKTEGMETLNRIGASGRVEADSRDGVAMLAVRGLEVVGAFDQVSQALRNSTAMNPSSNFNPNGLTPGPNPGRFQDDRPAIIGGTYGTGSAGTGTTREVTPISGETLSKINRDGSPIPVPPNGDTNGSTGGLRPR